MYSPGVSLLFSPQPSLSQQTTPTNRHAISKQYVQHVEVMEVLFQIQETIKGLK